MTAKANTDELNFTTKSTIEFTGISKLAEDKDHRLVAHCSDVLKWAIWVDIPKCSSDDRWMQIYFKPSVALVRQLGEKHTFNVTFTLQSLSGKELEYGYRSFTHAWSLEDEHGNGYSKYANWDVLWKKNEATRQEDGFRVVVEVTASMSEAPRPVVSNNALLKDLSNLVHGVDVMNTKFWAYRGRRVNSDGTVGADDPGSIFASSSLLQSQSDYFDSSESMTGFIKA